MNSKQFQRPNFDPWLKDSTNPVVARFTHPFQVSRVPTGVIVRYGLVHFQGAWFTPEIAATPITATWSDNLITLATLDEGYILIKLTVDDTDPYVSMLTAPVEIVYSATLPTNTLTIRYFVLAALGPEVSQQWFKTLMCARAGDYNEIDNLRFW